MSEHKRRGRPPKAVNAVKASNLTHTGADLLPPTVQKLQLSGPEPFWNEPKLRQLLKDIYNDGVYGKLRSLDADMAAVQACERDGHD